MHSPEARARAIRGIYTGSLTLALFAGTTEVNDAAYKRQSVSIAFNGALASNANEIRFGPWAADARAELTGWAIFDGSTELVRGELTPRALPRRPSQGEVAVFPAGEFVDEMGA